jgi:hypothetical protein
MIKELSRLAKVWVADYWEGRRLSRFRHRRRRRDMRLE